MDSVRQDITPRNLCTRPLVYNATAAVAANRGTDPYIFLLRTLDRNGLATRDVPIVSTDPNEGQDALCRGSGDAWSCLVQLSTQATADT